jgi:CubicO group peptidase (beta-lactamase class C family)
MKKIFFGFIVASAVALLGLTATDNTHLLKAFRVVYLRGNTDATINDFKVQPTRVIKAGKVEPWSKHQLYNTVPLSNEIMELHKKMESLAFLVIKDGELLNEYYFNEGSENHVSGVWSVTKTYTSLLILKAIEDGLIDHIDDPVSKYIPEMNFNQNEPLTLRHLASMSAGLYWNEMDHTPLALITKLNFTGNMEKVMIEEMYAIGEPGEIQHYNSGGTQILGIVLQRVLGDKTISDYLSEKFWQPLGCEYDALFILDSKKHGKEKAFGGLVATARDVSKLGQLILNEGNWKGRQLLSKDDIHLIHHLPYNNTTYTFGLWSGMYEGDRFYYQAGFRGQFCISFPKYNLVITRLGHHTTPKNDLEDVSEDVVAYIQEALRILNEAGLKETVSVDI